MPDDPAALPVPPLQAASPRTLDARASAAAKRAPTSADAAVGQRIRHCRLGRRLSLSELSTRVGVSNPQMHRYECGLTRVAASRLIAIAAALDVPVDTLLGGTVPAGQAEEAEVELLLRAFHGIGQRERRSALIALARSMAQADRDA